MNFLAHLYLSENHTDVMIGNFIADHIKGNQFKHMPTDIKKGILLHRQIDYYTDTHPIVKQSKRRLNPIHRHYKGVIIDVFYDHFLAKNWSTYSQIPLEIYTTAVYKLLQKEKALLPEKTKTLLPYMVQYNWLYNYQFTDGIQDVLNGMDRRTKTKTFLHLATEDLEKHHKEFNQDFTAFFTDIIAFSNQKRNELLNQ